MKKILIPILSALLFISTMGCKQGKSNNKTASKSFPLEMPEWANNANIYEINVRQFSKEGTFAAVTAQLSRLKSMGTDIIWLMPIFPLGEKNKKGTIGSHYAVRDYKSPNPAYGTMADFKNLVGTAHKLGIKVILDWVPNHTAWDNAWITQHPDWYTKNAKGEITDPLNEKGESVGWADVADLNYNNPEMCDAMTEALTYWVREADIDGYRMDVAGFVPYEFWDALRPKLHQYKQLFMLAEWEDPNLFKNKAFDMCYGWEFHSLMKKVYKGEEKPQAIDAYLEKEIKNYVPGYIKMQFTQNHDENSWNGTEKELFGDYGKTFFVLAATIEGSMPCVYNGQESDLNKRLEFFDKDAIDWKSYQSTDFYRTMLKLKHDHKALWNGKHGGKQTKVTTSADDQVYAFTRENDGDKVMVILNLGSKNQNVTLNGESVTGKYKDLFSGNSTSFAKGDKISLSAWEYKVFTMTK